MHFGHHLDHSVERAKDDNCISRLRLQTRTTPRILNVCVERKRTIGRGQMTAQPGGIQPTRQRKTRAMPMVNMRVQNP
jgi:hypothetical protein